MMGSTAVDHITRFVNPPGDDHDTDDGVEGNSRLTGALGMVLLVALFIEGITLVIGVNEMLVVHIFVGFLVIPPVLAKVGATTWRMVRYYTHDARFTRKGPPHPVLRVIGPLVILATVVLLATGVAMIIAGGANSRTWRDLHQTTFIVWGVLMTVHVLGHLAETLRLSAGDWAPRHKAVKGASARRWLVVATVLVGLGLGVLSIGWTHSWNTAWEAQRHDTFRPPGG